MKIALFAVIFSAAVISTVNSAASLSCIWSLTAVPNSATYLVLFGSSISSNTQCTNLVSWVQYINSYAPYLSSPRSCTPACTNGQICSTRPTNMRFQCGAGTGTGNIFQTTAAGVKAAIRYAFLQTTAPAPLTAAPAAQCLCPIFNSTTTTGCFATNIGIFITQLVAGAYSTSTGILDAYNPTNGQCQLLSSCPSGTFSDY